MIRERWPDIAFVAACLVSFAFFMWLASGFSFWNDGWAFIKTADDWSLDQLMQPHNEHWQLLNKLAHKLLMATVGLRTYVPYQAIAILLHVAIAAGIYTYARRHTPGLVALAIGVVFLFLGTGSEDYFMAFQMGYNFAAAAGVWALVLLMREPGPRHAWLAALLLVLGVMSMGVALFFLAAAAAVVAVSPSRRRLWWVVAPAIVIYGAWYLLYGRNAVGDLPAWPLVAEYARDGIAYAIGEVSGLRREIGLVLAVLLGIAALRNLAGDEKLRLGLLAGSVGLVTQYVVTGLARADTLPESFMAGRYMHIAAVFILIALVGLLDGRQLARPGDRFRLVLAVGAIAGVSLWWNVSRAFFIQDHWEAKIDQTRATISLMLAYGGSPAVPDDRGLRLVPGGEVRAVGEGERALIPGAADLRLLFDRYGSPLEDPLAVRGVAIPARVMDKAFVDLVAGSLVITPGVVPEALAPITVEAVSDARTSLEGSCLRVDADGPAPRIRMSLPSAAALYASPDDGGAVQLLLSLNGTYAGDPLEVELAPAMATRIGLPDIGEGRSMLLELQLSGPGTTRLCLGAAQPS